jgi:hypothetical protein
MISRIALAGVCSAALACGDNARGQAASPTPPRAPAVASPGTPAPTAQPSHPSQPSSSGSKYPVKWSSASALELQSAEQARALYKRDEPDLFGELEGEGQTLRPKNCVQWAELHSKKL